MGGALVWGLVGVSTVSNGVWGDVQAPDPVFHPSSLVKDLECAPPNGINELLLGKVEWGRDRDAVGVGRWVGEDVKVGDINSPNVNNKRRVRGQIFIKDGQRQPFIHKEL